METKLNAPYSVLFNAAFAQADIADADGRVIARFTDASIAVEFVNAINEYEGTKPIRFIDWNANIQIWIDGLNGPDKPEHKVHFMLTNTHMVKPIHLAWITASWQKITGKRDAELFGYKFQPEACRKDYIFIEGKMSAAAAQCEAMRITKLAMVTSALEALS